MYRTPSIVGDEVVGKAPSLPIISTSFSGYEPPFDLAPIVRRMLESVPREYLLGLGEVVLTNRNALTRKQRRSVVKSRRRKVSVGEVRGLYHPAFNEGRAWIEIFVDNTLRGWERSGWLQIPLLREAKIGDVLFHEIGHHIHFSHRPEYREREDVADVWKVRLQRQYAASRFRWMATLGRLLRPLLGSLMDRQRARVDLRMLRAGQISHAEYKEITQTPRSGKP